MNNEKNIVLNLYCDEIKEYPLKISLTNTFEKWTYLGILIVPDFISDAFQRLVKSAISRNR